MTPADAERVVETHLSSFPGFFLSELGPAFLGRYYRAVCSDQSGIALVGLDENGRVAGFAAGTSNPRGFYTRLLKKQWLKFAAASLPAVMKNPLIIPRLLKALNHPGENPAGPEVAGLYSIGVAPGGQRQGLGRRLAGEFLKEAKARGCRQVFLTTDRDHNQRVNDFYRGIGFSLKRTFETAQGRGMNEYWLDL
jgi:ribosomal protein S18 acetylase RimI-like enzyme